MAAHLTVISKNSVSKIRDEGELDTFFKEHPAAQVSTDPLFYAEGGLLFKANSCLWRIPFYCLSTLSTPVGTSEEKLIRWLLRNQPRLRCSEKAALQSI